MHIVLHACMFVLLTTCVNTVQGLTPLQNKRVTPLHAHEDRRYEWSFCFRMEYVLRRSINECDTCQTRLNMHAQAVGITYVLFTEMDGLHGDQTKKD